MPLFYARSACVPAGVQVHLFNGDTGVSQHCFVIVCESARNPSDLLRFIMLLLASLEVGSRMLAS